VGRRAVALYVVAMAAVVVAVDVLFFRGHVGERLAANAGIVLAFIAVYVAFRRRA
jgi:hypothetical protein